MVCFRAALIIAVTFMGFGGNAQIVRRQVTGYADLHVHQFTNESMAGAWMYGQATGPMATAMPRCNGNVPLAGGRNHGAFDKSRAIAIAGPLWGALISQLASESAGADTGLHAARRHGYCQANVIAGPGMCRGSLACNLLSQANCAPPPTYVCEWRSVGSMCRDKPGDGIGVGTACNLISQANCANVCSWSLLLCRGNTACNLVSKSNCGSNVCAWQSIGSICRDRDGDGKNVGVACNLLGQSACSATCSWDPNWGSLTLHEENRQHDWTDRNTSNRDKASWPSWDAIAHQQVHTTWLHDAYQNGLRLMVMSALNNETFCELLPLANRAPGGVCDDMTNVLRQFNAAIALDADPSTSWYEIAYTAADARRIISQNKLAVILSVEASDIFNTANPLGTLQTLYDKGARTLQPLHQFNSKLGGVAFHDHSIRTLQTVKNLVLDGPPYLCKTNHGAGLLPAKCDATLDQLNYLGLTSTGKRFAAKMLNLGMPIDIAHMSERSVKDVETIVTAACNYPVYVSHGHARTLLDVNSWKANKRDEKTVPDWELDLVSRTGGMFGLRTGADHHKASDYFAAIQTAGLQTSIPSVFPELMDADGKIGGNEFHFAYALDYLFRVKNVKVALGSDLNGLIPQMVFRGESHDTKMAGLAHIGKLPVMFSKLAATGLDAATYSQLKERSAEAYLQMWERAAAFARGDACCPTPSVMMTVPNQGWYNASIRVTVHGSGFTPHASMQVSVRPTPASAPIACTNVEFVSSTQLRCSLPPLTAGTWYYVTVRNGGCGLEATKQNSYYASPTATIPATRVAVESEPPFVPVNVRTALANENPSNGWLTPNAAKIAAIDWTNVELEGITPPIRYVPADRPLEDGFPQRDWEAAVSSRNRQPITPALDALLNREDAALLTDPITMIALCDSDSSERARVAAARGWPANWREQMASLCATSQTSPPAPAPRP